MDLPSSSNVTGRRKRAVTEDEMADDPLEGATPMRRVRGNKKIPEEDVAPNEIVRNLTTVAGDIINLKKAGARNCFEYKSPLELYSIEQMIEANASIQEMSIVLDSAQYLFGHRVDRLLHDVRHVDSILSGGSLNRENGENEDVHLSLENRKAKKKMAVADGISGVSELLDQIGEEELLNNAGGGNDARNNDEEGDDDRDAIAMNAEVDLFLERKKGVLVGSIVNQIVMARASHFKGLLSQDHNSFVPADENAHDIKDSSIDFLRTNPTFQKATKGSLDNKANSFHSLNYYGIHSPTGRALILHSRIEEDKTPFFSAENISESLAKNTRMLLHNSLERKPHILDNYLMLEVKDRPVIGKYKEVKKDAPKKAILPLAEPPRDQDLTNQTFAEASIHPVNMNVTVAGASDISMLPGSHGLPLTNQDNDETMGRATPDPDQTVSAPRSRTANDEYIPPSLDTLNMEESLIGKLPYDPMEMDKLSRIFDDKLETANTSDAVDAKVWKNGMRAEEWGEDDDSAMKSDTKNAIQAGIEGWIKATDAWTNYDVVKMIVNREARMQLDETAIDEQESHKNLIPEIGKNFFLVRSDEFMNSYPKDRPSEKEVIGDETDVMKVWAAGENDNGQPLEVIQKEIVATHNQAEAEIEQMEENEHDGDGNFDIEFDNNLAAPVDFDDVDPVNNNRVNDGNEIRFDDQMDEIEAPVRDERFGERDLRAIAIGESEIAELNCNRNLEEKVGPTAEMRDEIRNMGRVDNAHWIPPEIAIQENQAEIQRKRREKKAKTRKVTVEDFVNYFRDVPEEEIDSELTNVISKSNEKCTIMTEAQLYLPSLGLENKPHIAFEMGILSNSGLFYKKSYGKIKLERVKNPKAAQDVIVDELKSNKDSDCLNWLATFSGFRCMENPEAVGSSTDEQDAYDYDNDNMNDMDFDNGRDEIQAVAAHMRPDLQQKYVKVSTDMQQMFMYANRGTEDGDDTLDEFDDSFDRQTIQAKNLDAAKHKKCLAEILKSEHLSMPSIQFALEQLSLNATRADNTTIRDVPGTSEGDATSASPHASFEADKTLTAVFDYKATNKQPHVNVNDIVKALTEIPDYQEEPPVASATRTRAVTSEYGTENTEHRQVQIQGCHTLLSLALSMPTKMGENVRPSSIVAFLLHIANENGLNIVQDRSKRSWMSDFMVLNTEKLPDGVTIGSLDAQGEFWKRTQDPDAVEGGEADNSTIFRNMPPRVIATPSRRRVVAQSAPSADLGPIEEIDEMA